jgi:hypothetical protein
LGKVFDKYLEVKEEQYRIIRFLEFEGRMKQYRYFTTPAYKKKMEGIDVETPLITEPEIDDSNIFERNLFYDAPHELKMFKKFVVATKDPESAKNIFNAEGVFLGMKRPKKQADGSAPKKSKPPVDGSAPKKPRGRPKKVVQTVAKAPSAVIDLTLDDTEPAVASSSEPVNSMVDLTVSTDTTAPEAPTATVSETPTTVPKIPLASIFNLTKRQARPIPTTTSTPDVSTSIPDPTDTTLSNITLEKARGRNKAITDFFTKKPKSATPPPRRPNESDAATSVENNSSMTTDTAEAVTNKGTVAVINEDVTSGGTAEWVLSEETPVTSAEVDLDENHAPIVTENAVAITPENAVAVVPESVVVAENAVAIVNDNTLPSQENAVAIVDNQVARPKRNYRKVKPATNIYMESRIKVLMLILEDRPILELGKETVDFYTKKASELEITTNKYKVCNKTLWNTASEMAKRNMAQTATVVCPLLNGRSMTRKLLIRGDIDMEGVSIEIMCVI